MSEPDPLNGLRGLATLHVFYYHLISHSEWSSTVNLMGNLSMPLFYLMSGYCMTLGYGKKENIDWRKYLLNRFARTAPMYWLTNFLLFVGPNLYLNTWKDHSPGEMVVLILMTFTCTNTWFYPFIQDYQTYFPLNPVSWTLNTLFFFYLAFPLLLPQLKRLSDGSISRWLVLLFWIQSVPLIVYWTRAGDDPHEFLRYYWIFTVNPVMRLPVFVMGILAGLQSIRWKGSGSLTDPNESKNLLFSLVPWGLQESEEGPEQQPENSQDARVEIWRNRTNVASLVFLLFLAAASQCTEKYTPTYIVVHGYGSLFLIHITIGLHRTGGASYLARLCNTSFLQMIGNISICVYLVHEDILKYVQVFPQLLLFERQTTDLIMPDMILVSLVVISLAKLLHEFFEEPLRQLSHQFNQKQATVDNCDIR